MKSCDCDGCRLYDWGSLTLHVCSCFPPTNRHPPSLSLLQGENELHQPRLFLNQAGAAGDAIPAAADGAAGGHTGEPPRPAPAHSSSAGHQRDRSVITPGIVESNANLSFHRTTCIGMCCLKLNSRWFNLWMRKIVLAHSEDVCFHLSSNEIEIPSAVQPLCLVL